MNTLLQVLNGFGTLLLPANFLSLLVGFLIGVVFAIIPGLTATLAIVLLLPC